jgi:hypothetical protein
MPSTHWGTLGSDLVNPQYLWDRKWKPTDEKQVYKSKKRTNPPPRRSLQEIFQKVARCMSTPSSGADATGEPAVVISVKGRDALVMRNLPKVISRTLLSGVSSSDIPLEGASSSSIPTEGESLRHLASGAGRFQLVRIKLSGCAR